MGFDVMREPWIDCVGLDGRAQIVGIRELLLRAHALKEIRDASPLYEYGIYRLLTVMVMDMLRPQDAWDIQDMLENGCFEAERVDAYIAECEKDGPRFDLFDPLHPFLQDAFDARYDGDSNIKPVAVLMPELPSGNNHIHFTHAPVRSIGYAECAKALCAVSVFCTAGLQGPSSINGAPPMYVFVKGKTLFSTLTANCLCEDANKTPAYADPPPAFKSDRLFSPGEKMASTSLLEGMTLKARRVQLIDGEGAVERARFQKGVDFVGYEAWRDPHTVVSAKGSAVKPNMDKELWRNTASIFGENGSAPLTLGQYISISGLPRVDVIVYGLCTNQAALITWSREELSMPLGVIKSDWRMQMVSDAIVLSEETAKEIRKALNSIHIGSRASWEEIACMSTGKYYAAIRSALFTSFVPALLLCEPDTAEALAKEWKAKLRQTALEFFAQGADKFGDAAEILLQAARAEDRLRGRLKKLLTKEGV